MKILAEISAQPDAAELLRQMHLDEGSAEAAEFVDLFKRSAEVAVPKAAYRECFIDARDDDSITIDGQVLHSRILRENVADAQRVFPFVITCGTELDGVEIDSGDFLQEYWLDAIKAAWLDVARQFLVEHLRGLYPYLKTTSMSPGSGDIGVWPIEDQRPLFAILGNVRSAIGVELTDSLLMKPNKTISGIRYPSEQDFRTCRMCHRENCPTRKVPLDEVWAAKHNGER